MGTKMQDLRWALRSLRRSPLFAVVAVVTLAVGIGASTATFSVVNTVLFKAPPYADPGHLVSVWPGTNFNNAMVREAASEIPAIESVAGISGWGLTLVGEGDPLQVRGSRVTANYFRVLGVAPALGRGFADDEGLPGRGDVVVLSHAFWTRVFGGDPSVIGRRIQLSGADAETHTVIGVMPAGFRALINQPDLWVPLSSDPAATLTSDDSWYVNHRVARLAPGATLEQANQQIRSWAASLHERMPSRYEEAEILRAGVEPLGEYLARDMQPVLWAALAAVSLVLLIACANVANLLLARGESRGHDLAVRSALGAGRHRVVRMLLAESGILGVVGGGLGVLGAFALVRIVVSLAPSDFPRIREVTVDGTVLAYALGVTAVVTIISGLFPAVRMSRVDAAAALGRTTRATSARRSSRLTLALVGAEVALAVVVTVGSGLMVRSLQRLTTTDVGIDPTGVLVLQPSPPEGRYRTTEDFVRYYGDVMERVAAIPDVDAVGAIHLLPGTQNNWNFPAYPEGVDVPEGTPPPVANFRMVQGDYFTTLGLPLLRGRVVNDEDRGETEKVVVVNQAFTDRYWTGLDPVGKSLRILSRTGEPFRVVGVVGNLRQHGFSRPPEPEMYISTAQWQSGTALWLMVRMRGGDGPLSHLAAVQKAVWSVDAQVPIAGADELASVFDRSAASTRFLTLVLGSFGVLALILGAIGVFGVTAYSVGRRTSEFGVRLALGSSRASVLRRALATCGAPVVAGLVAGSVDRGPDDPGTDLGPLRGGAHGPGDLRRGGRDTPRAWRRWRPSSPPGGRAGWTRCGSSTPNEAGGSAPLPEGRRRPGFQFPSAASGLPRSITTFQDPSVCLRQMVT